MQKQAKKAKQIPPSQNSPDRQQGTSETKDKATKESWVTFRVTLDELKRIEHNAEQADDMKVSAYCRARALRLTLRNRLTKHQEELLENLAGCRSDIYHYGNALNAMSPENKSKMFNNREKMLEWLGDLLVMGEKIKAFLEGVRRPNRSRTSNSSNEEEDV